MRRKYVVRFRKKKERYKISPPLLRLTKAAQGSKAVTQPHLPMLLDTIAPCPSGVTFGLSSFATFLAAAAPVIAADGYTREAAVVFRA